jgi:hypothetical protein
MTGNNASASGRGSLRTDAVTATSIDGASALESWGSVARRAMASGRTRLTSRVCTDGFEHVRLERGQIAALGSDEQRSQLGEAVVYRIVAGVPVAVRLARALAAGIRHCRPPQRPASGSRWSGASPSR